MTDIRYEQAVRAVVERFLTAAGAGDLDALPAMFASKANITVHIEDGQLAFVRADASIVVDGQVRSHNIDYFTLIQDNGAWKFLNASYTVKPPAPQ